MTLTLESPPERVLGVAARQAVEVTAEALSAAGNEGPAQALLNVSGQFFAGRPEQRRGKTEDMSWWTGTATELWTPALREVLSAATKTRSTFGHSATSKYRRSTPDLTLDIEAIIHKSLVSRKTNEVFRVIRIEDFANKNQWKKRPPKSQNIVPMHYLPIGNGGQYLSRRPFVQYTLADNLDNLPTYYSGALQMRNRSFNSSALELRLEILRSILLALLDLHKQEFIHGDLRPENISLDRRGTAALFDVGVVRPWPELSIEQRVYRAPESSSERTQGKAADVYSFGKVAQRLLGSAIWDSRQLPNGLHTDAFEWILDYCTLIEPHDRPSVEDILAAMFNTKGPALKRTAMASLRRASFTTNSWLKQNSVTPLTNAFAISSPAAAKIEYFCTKYPETRLSVAEPDNASNLLRRLIIDSRAARVHNQKQERPLLSPLKGNGEPWVDKFVEKKEFRTDIDAVWKNRLHVRNFGFSIQPQHDEMLAASGDNPEVAAETARYRAQIEAVTRARTELLASDTYLYTREVAHLLSNTVSTTSEAHVATLRRWGHLLAVTDHGRWLYPLFQFDSLDGRPISLVQEVNDRSIGIDQWDTLVWWHIPRSSIEGHRSFAQAIGETATSHLVRRALDRAGR